MSVALSNMHSACAVLYCHLWPVPFYNSFCTLSYKLHDFRKKVTEHKMCVLVFSTAFCWNIFIVRRIMPHTVTNVRNLYVRYPLYLSDFNETWIFSTGFWQNFKYQISWKSIKWKSNCSMRTERRTDNVVYSLLSQFWVRTQNNRCWQTLTDRHVQPTECKARSNVTSGIACYLTVLLLLLQYGVDL